MRLLTHLTHNSITHDLSGQKLKVRQREAARGMHYEVASGMKVRWVEIVDAIDHTQKVMASQPTSMGISILRETFVLQRVAEELIESEVTA